MSNKTVIIIIISIILITGGFLVWKNQQEKKTEQNQQRQQGEQQEQAEKINENQQEIDTSDWKTYRDEKYGFEFKYPLELLLEEVNDNKIGKIVSLKLLDANATDLNGNPNPRFNYIFEVSHWASINNKYAPGGEWDGQRQYKNLEDFFTDPQAPKKKTGEIWLGSQKAYEVKIAGIAATYGIMFERNDGVWQIEFPSVFEKEYLGNQEKEIIASFKIEK